MEAWRQHLILPQGEAPLSWQEAEPNCIASFAGSVWDLIVYCFESIASCLCCPCNWIWGVLSMNSINDQLKSALQSVGSEEEPSFNYMKDIVTTIKNVAKRKLVELTVVGDQIELVFALFPARRFMEGLEVPYDSKVEYRGTSFLLPNKQVLYFGRKAPCMSEVVPESAMQRLQVQLEEHLKTALSPQGLNQETVDYMMEVIRGIYEHVPSTHPSQLRFTPSGIAIVIPKVIGDYHPPSRAALLIAIDISRRVDNERSLIKYVDCEFTDLGDAILQFHVERMGYSLLNPSCVKTPGF